MSNMADRDSGQYNYFFMKEKQNINTSLSCKEVLTTEEAARFLGITKSYLYKLTMQRLIPHYKPMGKLCYFIKAELMEWLQTNRVKTDTEINDQAQEICQKGGKG